MVVVPFVALESTIENTHLYDAIYTKVFFRIKVIKMTKATHKKVTCDKHSDVFVYPKVLKNNRLLSSIYGNR